MKIIADRIILVMRFSNYKKYNFIEEHKKVIAEKGDVWILKAGQGLTSSRLQAVLDDGGQIVLKEPKSSGGKFYLLHMVGYSIGEPTDEMSYPIYYEEMEEDYDCWTVESLQGTWIKIDKIEVISNSLEDIFLVSNSKPLVEVLNSTRSSVVYAISKNDIEI